MPVRGPDSSRAFGRGRRFGRRRAAEQAVSALEAIRAFLEAKDNMPQIDYFTSGKEYATPAAMGIKGKVGDAAAKGEGIPM